jgi:hypothetical protein
MIVQILKALKLLFVSFRIVQFYLPPTRFIPTRVEHNIRNDSLNVVVHFTSLERMEAWVKLSAQEWS